jgi:hypothetical protein
VYNIGFRCAADAPPAGLVREPGYRVKQFDLPATVHMRPDLYRREPIRLEPTDRSTLLIRVPWFPQSVWVLDCPESTWGEFGGANAWPHRDRAEWHIPWEQTDNGRRLSYVRERPGQRISMEIWTEADTVHFAYETKGVAASPEGFCFKTFSPFFTSQERRTQCRWEAGQPVRCDTIPLQPQTAASFGWSIGSTAERIRGGLLSYDGSARIVLADVPFETIFGNGCYPCIHARPATDASRRFAGSYTFAIST